MKAQSATSTQKMREFFDRVAALNLPPATEYLLLVLVFKSFIMHSPERIFVGWIRGSKTKEADENQDRQIYSTGQDPPLNSHNSKAKVKKKRQNEDKDALAKQIVVNGTTIQCSDFFKIRSRPLFCITIPNKLVSWLLNPNPRPLPPPKTNTNPGNKPTNSSCPTPTTSTP